MALDTLQNCVRALRAEAGHSLAVSQGVNQVDTLKYILKRTQEELWTSFLWPTLVTRVNVPVTPNQYIVSWPLTITFDAVRQAFYADANSAEWIPIAYGLEETLIKPDDTNTQAGTPVQFWEAKGDTQFRIWPTPTIACNIRFKGLRQLDPFVSDNQMSTIDATAIVLFAASELLARAKAEDAANKLQKAQRHLSKLLGRKISDKFKISTLGSGYRSARPTPGLDYIPTSM